MDGELLNDWVEASARLVHDLEMDRKVDRLLSKKYGLMKSLFGLAASIRGRKNAIIEIEVLE